MIILKSLDEIKRMRVAGKIVAEILKEVTKHIETGITTIELDKIAENEIIKRGAEPTFKGYQRSVTDLPFPGCICVSINEEVVHGIPSNRKICNGDIVSIDIGVKAEGFCSDSAVTIPINVSDENTLHLLKVTEEALYLGIEKAIEGNRLQDISHTIQRHIEKANFAVVREFVGHGIGRLPHEDPQVPNYGKPGCGKRLEEGMVLAIEPMVNMGSYKVNLEKNGWTAVTADKSLSAHFEHTVAITQNGPEILSIV